jgi:glycine/D-amino acid oxidase-like deaminating enzyme
VDIVIIGAGLSGLACCYHLQMQTDAKIVIYDRNGIAGGASGIAAGLIHPYAGPKCKLNWLGYQAEKEALSLFHAASCEPVQRGIFRPCITDEQKASFFACSQKHPETKWWDEAMVKEKAPFLTPLAGLFIPQGLAIDTKQYLENLWKVCQSNGATLELTSIEHLDDLKKFDKVIVATGAHVHTLCGKKQFKISQLKGQTLELALPENQVVPSFAINGSAYLVMSKATHSCTVGATFERQFDDILPNRKGEMLIRQKLREFAPTLADLPLLNHKADLRAYTQDKMPKIYRLSEKEWCITAMGSKGLLYHGLVAKLLVQAMLADDLSLLPQTLTVED